MPRARKNGLSTEGDTSKREKETKEIQTDILTDWVKITVNYNYDVLHDNFKKIMYYIMVSSVPFMPWHSSHVLW